MLVRYYYVELAAPAATLVDHFSLAYTIVGRKELPQEVPKDLLGVRAFVAAVKIGSSYFLQPEEHLLL
jgi:hypothetical protein